LARFDAGGALRVGPESAGSAPGPICYGQGELPTVTDANLILGRLPAERFLGGDFKLDLPRTQRVVRAWLKDNRSTMSMEEFAAGVVRVVNANMEKAIRVVSIERGYDPREFALVAFGGAGAMHACDLAQVLRIPKVIVPAYPGGLSALGILISDVVKDHSRTVLLRVRELPEKELDRLFAGLQSSVGAELQKEGWKGRAVFEKSCDLRYRGQGYELNLRYGRDLLGRFHAEHRRRYGYSSPEREIEIVTVRLRARVPSPEKLAKMKIRPMTSKSMTEGAQSQSSMGRVWFDGKEHDARIMARESLKPGKSYRGPAVITEYSATTVVPPGLRMQVDKAGNLIVETAG
jgi:N-methylhydantoinase A